MPLGEKLAVLRKKQGISQDQLAEEMGVSRQAVSRWEVGAVTPSMEKLRRLGEFYNISMDLLLDDQRDLTEREEATTEGQSPEPAGKKHFRRMSRREVGFLVFGVILALVAIGISIWIARKDVTKQSELQCESVGDTIDGVFSLENWNGEK